MNSIFTRKRISTLVLVLTLLVSVLPAKAARGIPYIWVECEQGTVVQGQFRAATATNASGGSFMKVDCQDEEEHELKVNFSISNPGEYDLFVVGTPGDKDWSSTRQWKLNDAEYSVEKYQEICSAYSSGDVRGVPLYWYKMTTADLEEGNHSVSFKIKNKASVSGLVLTYLDCFVAVPKEWGFVPNGMSVMPFDKNEVNLNYVSGTIPDTYLEPEQEFDVTINFRSSNKTEGTPKLYAALTYKGDIASKSSRMSATKITDWGVGVAHAETFTLKVPFNAPNGIYEIRCGVEDIGFEDGTNDVVVGEVQVGKELPKKVEPMTVRISNAQLPDVIEKGKEFEVTADVEWGQTINFETTPYISIWQGDVLWGVIEGETKLNNSTKQIVFKGKLEEDIPAGSYQAYVGTHWLNFEKTAGKSITISGTDSIRSQYHKPMSYGYYYSQKTGRTQFWYIVQSCTAIWNGEPYIPFGGMAVPHYLYSYRIGDDAGNKARFEQDIKDLEKCKAAGIDDLYINPVNSFRNIPSWAVEYFFDYLEENGWYYGFQPALNESNTYREIYFPRATTRDYKVTDVKATGEVKLELKLPLGEGPIDCVYTVINDATGEMVDSGVGTAVYNTSGNVDCVANVKNVGAGANTIYFTPRSYASKRVHSAPNFWGDRDESAFNYYREWIKTISVGENLRTVIDISGNEMGVYNQNECTRFTGSGYEERYEKWLKEKYGTIDALNNAWKATPQISSFIEAAYMIPVYTADENAYTIYVHGETGKGYRIDTKKSVIHSDYMNGRDAIYLDFINEGVEIFKEVLDVPTIYKHCALQRDYFINDELVLGLDGVGSEAYGSSEKVTSSIGTTGSHAAQSARTQWNVITETNTSENVMGKYNGGESAWGYPDQDTFVKRWEMCLSNGTKGIYDFLLMDRPDLGGQLGQAYSWVENPSTIEYAKITQEYISDPDVIEMCTETMYLDDTFNVYPHHYNWWWHPNEREATIFSIDNNPHQILRAGGKWVINTDDLYGDVRLTFINLSDGPFTAQYGPEVSKFLNEYHPDKRICVLGHRNDLGAIPEIDKYYTAEKVAISDNETVQILNPVDGAQVLKTTADGKPWAIKAGELYIVSVDNWFKQDGEFCSIQYVDELGITDVSALNKVRGEAATAEPVYNGFADMKGHWAESYVNEAKDLGIASGVGNNMFNPEGKVTVAEFASLVTRVMDYADVQADSAYGDKWYAASMTEAYANGILTDELKGQPEKALLREEMAIIAAKALKADATNTDLSEYTDAADVSEGAKGYVKAASDLELLSGMGDGTFAPKSDLTRAQSMVVIKKIMELK